MKVKNATGGFYNQIILTSRPQLGDREHHIDTQTSIT